MDMTPEQILSMLSPGDVWSESAPPTLTVRRHLSSAGRDDLAQEVAWTMPIYAKGDGEMIGLGILGRDRRPASVGELRLMRTAAQRTFNELMAAAARPSTTLETVLTNVPTLVGRHGPGCRCD